MRRVTSQLPAKKEKFLQYRKNGIVVQGDLCIIGINCGDRNGFEVLGANSYVDNAFYPTGCKLWSEETSTWSAPLPLSKHSGEPVLASVLASAAFKLITGSILSPDFISSLLKLGTDFRYIPNRNSSYSLPPKWIHWSEETITTGSEARLVMGTIRSGVTVATDLGPFPSSDA